MSKLSLIIVFVFACFFSKADIPVLEREVNLSFSNEPIAGVLERIKLQTGAVFSYQSNILNGGAPITAKFDRKSIREVLSVILPKNLIFKPKNSYIIIKERPLEKPAAKTELSGYVYDASTDKKLANVTIYDKTTLQSVTTDEYGYYSITLPTKNQCLTVNKENYQDTCLPLLQEGSITSFSISPIKNSRDSLWKKRIGDYSTKTNNLFKRFKGYVNTLNVRDTLDRNFQFSLMPFVGTNGLMSGNVYNRYSINLLGGYSRGNKLLEVGSVFNINKENMNGAQFAGMFNIVGDSVKGAQFAGFVNVTGRSIQGFQGSGFMNSNFGNVNGVTAAGFMNLNAKQVNGVTGAGFMNLNAGKLQGLAVAGFMNVCGDTLHGATVAGFMNINKASKRSIEGAGFMNVAKFAKDNFQVAGVINITHEGSSRLQISGFLNKTPMLTGIQIGMFNYCDSAKGIPIGFLSIVKHGLHQVEISSDEVFYSNVSVRTGVKEFYNILSYGIQPTGQNFWHLGYGLGTSFKLVNKWRSDINLSTHHVNSGGFYFGTSDLYKLYIGTEYKLAKKMSLAFGPTINLYVSDAIALEYEGTYSHVAPYAQYNHTTKDDFNLKGWIGGKIALRFF
ncbi:MAG: carboxypeptidase-like regulatory domain-containing protein [Bacteroidota bacterium]|nr:carboxypeptidase-like regulatory domain-containing protein [Bacteroidota bacterium]